MAVAPQEAEWASDGTQVVDPPSGLKLAGWAPGQVPPAQFFNWILYVLVAWVNWLRGSVAGSIVGSPRLYTAPAVTGVGVWVEGIATITLAGATLEAPTTAVEVVGGALSPNLWYYVYASDGGAGLRYARSTTPPDARQVWMTGSTIQRYIGCFRTNGSSVPIPFGMQHGRYVYRLSDLAGGATQVVTGGTSTTYADVDCSPFVPPHARVAELGMYLSPNGAAGQLGGATVRTNGALSSGGYAASCGYGASAPAVDRSFAMELDAAQTAEYRVTTAGGAQYPTLYLDVLGYSE